MIKRVLVSAVAIIGILFMIPTTATAMPTNYMAADCGKGVSALLGLKSWDACLKKDSNGVPQIKKLTDIWLILLPLLESAIKIAGYTAAGFVIWGGIKYLKSQGDPSQLTQAREVIYNSLFGLVIVMMSVGIVMFIASKIDG